MNGFMKVLEAGLGGEKKGGKEKEKRRMKGEKTRILHR